MTLVVNIPPFSAPFKFNSLGCFQPIESSQTSVCEGVAILRTAVTAVENKDGEESSVEARRIVDVTPSQMVRELQFALQNLFFIRPRSALDRSVRIHGGFANIVS